MSEQPLVVEWLKGDLSKWVFRNWLKKQPSAAIFMKQGDLNWLINLLSRLIKSK